MTTTVSQARQWRPEPFIALATEWDTVSGRTQVLADRIEQELAACRERWQGLAADAACAEITHIGSALRNLSRVLVLAAAEARDGAVTTELAQHHVIATVSTAESEGCVVTDDGSIEPPLQPTSLLVLLAGGHEPAADSFLDVRATHLSVELKSALSDMTEADTATARSIDTALAAIWDISATGPVESSAAIVAQWPQLSQDQIAAQLAALSPTALRQLVREAAQQVGNTDGVPWPMRVEANRLNIANAILAERRVLNRPVEDKLAAAISPTLDPASAERLWAVLHADPAMNAAAIATHDRVARQRIELYQALLADTADPINPERRISRQILAFDPVRSSLIELAGDLSRASAVGVLVPGLNTTWETSAEEVTTSARFVYGSAGKVAMITYLGGRFPTGDFAAGLFAAADPRYALEMAPRLVAFSEDVDRTMNRLGRPVPVTYIGHSYGGSIVGTAERFGLTADRVIYAEAAGSGFGVQNPDDWHNRNPDVRRFALTAPGDWISLVQGLPFGPHGADPDEMPGVTRLAAGRRLNGWPMFGPTTHSDVLTEPSDAWRNMLAVILGDDENIRAE